MRRECWWMYSSLYCMSRYRNEVVRALISIGADVDKARDDVHTPLDFGQGRGHTAVVQALKAAEHGLTCRYVSEYASRGSSMSQMFAV